MLKKRVCRRWWVPQARTLVEMGFEHASALSALQTTGGAVEEALHTLLTLGESAPSTVHEWQRMHLHRAPALAPVPASHRIARLMA